LNFELAFGMSKNADRNDKSPGKRKVVALAYLQFMACLVLTVAANLALSLLTSRYPGSPLTFGCDCCLDQVRTHFGNGRS
jgi:hypothetical protein